MSSTADSSRRPRAPATEPLLIVGSGSEIECLITSLWIEAYYREHGIPVDVAALAETREIFEHLDSVRQVHSCPGIGEPWWIPAPVQSRADAVVVDLRRSWPLRLLGSITCARRRFHSPPGREISLSAICDRLQVTFRELGVRCPQVPANWRLGAATTAQAEMQLGQLGYRSNERPVLVVPRSAASLNGFELPAAGSGGILPLVLLPRGEELEAVAQRAGDALFVRADRLALRAALMRRGRCVVSDHPETLALARLLDLECQ